MNEKARQLTYVQPGKNLVFEAGINGSQSTVKEKPEKTSLEIEIEKLLGYEPDSSVVKRVKEIMVEKNLKKPSEAILFIND